MLRDARPPRAVAVVHALASLLLVPAATHADTGDRIALRWTAPAECPAADAVRAEVDRLLGPSSARPPAPIPVTAEVSRDDLGAWRVHLETPGQGTTRFREVHGASCAAIADATALILALMIDPAAVVAAPPAEVKGSPGVAIRPSGDAIRSPGDAIRPPADAIRSPVSATTSLPSAPTPTSFRASALAGLDTASLPQLAATLGLHGSFAYGAQRFELGLVFRPSRAATVAARPTAGGEVDLLTGSVGTCRHFGGAPLEIGPCVAFELGRLHASGFGVSSPGEGSTLWAAVEGGGVVTYRLFEKLAIVLRLGAAVPLLRPRFVLENVGAVFRPPVVTGRGSAGVELIF